MKKTEEELENFKTNYLLFRLGPENQNQEKHKEFLREFKSYLLDLKGNENQSNKIIYDRLINWLENMEIYDLEIRNF